MTQTDIHTFHQSLRQRAQVIIEALETAEPPATYADIIRAARAIMTVSKMVKQLWPEDDDDNTRTSQAADARPAQPQPLNRQQRRALAARQRTRPNAKSIVDDGGPSPHIPPPA